MKKADLIYLAYKLLTIASFTIGINIVMNKRYEHPYLIGAVVAFFGVLTLLKASDMDEQVSRCLLRRSSFMLFVGEMLMVVGFSVFALGIFEYLSLGLLQIKALFAGLIGTFGGGALYFYLCKEESAGKR